MSVTPAVMRRLMRELTELQANPLDCIRVITNEDNMLDVVGIVEGPEGTPYAGGYFKIKFAFTEEFPAAPPKCRMLTKIFHPNVSSSGEICVNTLKKDWKSTYGIGHILVTVKCLLIYPNPESALDEEAGKLLLENYDDYCSRAKLITSVHARTRPTQFDKPASSSTPSTSKIASAKAVPAASSLITPITPFPTAPSSAAPQKSAQPAPSLPLQSSSSNTIPTSPSASQLLNEKSTGKERQTSPSPLSMADSNVASTVKVDANAAAKAVKRAATGGIAGIEKRKKALKRL
ncbi:uncharacterized protein LAESUDRAFT_732325 [Laetiporus sulphureus 93-53]|uniref:E2 ubiquitin-conjugating enzyme n=1 Tax=Laetiporus sulphureus 93-53 TaxID=1314785 RepID=A0A165B712_9APHY|nr:uncharacterized protein LAESUDRAFT_732325 [Laetiporus sulphureus 93-53]KZT00392.1 hypothetical protein LAESUDRAFT_732325 [Laetiporus sulphureus 93-53]